jgi:hypothetical protein
MPLFPTLFCMNMTVFWDFAPCCLIEVYRPFWSTCYLHHQFNHRSDNGGIKNPVLFLQSVPMVRKILKINSDYAAENHQPIGAGNEAAFFRV